MNKWTVDDVGDNALKVKRVLRVSARGEKFEKDDDIGKKGRKKKGDNVRENSLVKKNV